MVFKRNFYGIGSTSIWLPFVLRYFTKHNLSFISKYWFGVKVKIAQKNSNTIFVLYHHEDSCTNSL